MGPRSNLPTSGAIDETNHVSLWLKIEKIERQTKLDGPSNGVASLFVKPISKPIIKQ